MTTHTSSATSAPTALATTCDDGWTPAHVTRSLLGWGVVAGPLYVLTSVAQGLTRDGFDFTKHQWSLLQNGDLGWPRRSPGPQSSAATTPTGPPSSGAPRPS